MPREQPSPPPDFVRLRHMLEAARSATRFCDGRARAALDEDEMLARAVLHALLEIGEAAARTSEAARRLAPGLPWGQIVETRNILVHVYWGVNLDKVWKTVQEDLPVLIREVEAALAGVFPPTDATDQRPSH